MVRSAVVNAGLAEITVERLFYLTTEEHFAYHKSAFLQSRNFIFGLTVQ
jgi:hypothetical protein